MRNYKEEFIELLQSTQREGVDYVIEDLTDLGFFEAPASTVFHLNYEGGLVEHSVNVCKVGLMLRTQMIEMKPELADELRVDSVILSTLLHDVCKSDIYKKVTKRKKTHIGVWEEYDGYDVDYSNLPIGHGEKSVVMLLRMGLDLYDEEIMAIRWHMSAWDLPFQSPELKSNINKAKDICPLCSLVQAADGLASNLLERKEDYED